MGDRVEASSRREHCARAVARGASRQQACADRRLTCVSVQTVRFLIAEQRFLEYLEARDHKKALSILRNELAPLNQDSDRLQQLSRWAVIEETEFGVGKR